MLMDNLNRDREVNYPGDEERILLTASTSWISIPWANTCISFRKPDQIKRFVNRFIIIQQATPDGEGEDEDAHQREDRLFSALPKHSASHPLGSKV